MLVYISFTFIQHQSEQIDDGERFLRHNIPFRIGHFSNEGKRVQKLEPSLFQFSLVSLRWCQWCVAAGSSLDRYITE